MPRTDAGLDTSGAAALLQQRFSLEVERHNEDIQHTEARLRSALKELEIVRGEEARALAQRTAVLQREHEAAMQALERRFLADAEALQVHLKEGVDRETALSQAAIDAAARELLGGLGISGVAAGGSLAAGAVPAAATFGWPPAAAAAVTAGGSSPPTRRLCSASSRPAAAASGVSPAAPPPAVAAANEAIAALRAQLPPSPAKLRASGSPARPAIKLTATSGGASGGWAAVPAPRAAPAVQRSPAPQPCPASAAPPALPTMAAAAAALRQPSAKPAGLSVRFAAEPASSTAPATARQASSTDGSGGRERGGLMAGSSSEFDGDSWLDEDSEGEEDLISARPPPVKTIQSTAHTPRNLAASRSASFAAIGAASATGMAAAIGAGVNGPSSPRGSGGKVHLNLIPAGGTTPGSPSALRSYSPCTCSNGAEAAGAASAPPLSPRAGVRMACCGVLSGAAARSYTSD